MRVAALLLLTAACVSPAAVETQPAAPPAWRMFAAEALERGDVDAAEAHATFAIEADPGDAVAWKLARKAAIRRLRRDAAKRRKHLTERWSAMLSRSAQRTTPDRPVLRRYPISDLIRWDPRSSMAREVFAQLGSCRVDLSFPLDTPLREVLAYLGRVSGLVVAMRADVARRFGNTKITLVASGLSLSDALTLALLQAGAGEVVCYEVVLGGVRLIDGMNPDPPRVWGFDVDDLVERLRHRCGDAKFVRDRGTLVVRAKPPVHDEIAAQFVAWRKRKARESVGWARRTGRR